MRRKRGGEDPRQMRFDFGAGTPGRAVQEALFFAILPGREAAHRAVEAGRALCARFERCGPVRPAELLHMSLLGFRVDTESLPAGVALCQRVGAAVRASAFPVVLEGAMSFGGEGHRALVLRGSQGAEAALTGLHDRIRDLTDDLGLTQAGVREAFAPHLTVAYDASPIPETALEAPIGWVADKLVLVRSEQGRGRHTHLGRWPLRAA